MQPNDSTLWPHRAAPAPAFCGDGQRAKVLAAHGFNSLRDDPELAEIARFAAQLCDAPVALVTLVEAERQRFLARTGVDIDETPRSTSLCAHAMMGGGLLVVPDATQDPRFADFELVTGEFGLRFYAGAPLASAEGAPIGALCVIDTAPRPDGLTDLQRHGLTVLAQTVKRRIQARRESRESEAEHARRNAQFRTLGDWLPDIIWSSDGEGRFDYFSGRWEKVTGRKPPRDIEGWQPFIHPDDWDATYAGWTDCSARGDTYEAEYRLSQTDGGWRWTMARALPVKNESGAVMRWFGTLTDIDEKRRQADSSGAVAHEMVHRIKNIFALISGLVSVRTRGHEELRDFGENLVGTIAALAKAQDFVRVSGAEGSGDLRGLVQGLLDPFSGEDSAHISVEGDTAPIGSRSATPLALVLHELATNSVKYGALSVETGRVAITLQAEDEDMVVHWVEAGGPEPVVVNEGRGFGTRLIDMSVTAQLDGKVERDWRKEGLAVTLRLSREKLAN
ncbi:sensor histidine kinase [Pelagerythrobacter aerophilus]|uniref:histidine kinase n=1 Tax=Pelagerythrobacter aerophilus TaxID=2306995 RepID=A0A418ND68_9SPHN|nr:PAS domain-containing protein [Pelagerythrobacter aerophilus]RIV75755.1 PAS domain S-box protein [Pelagerythrobacter aerophilus]